MHTNTSTRHREQFANGSEDRHQAVAAHRLQSPPLGPRWGPATETAAARAQGCSLGFMQVGAALNGQRRQHQHQPQQYHQHARAMDTAAGAEEGGAHQHPRVLDFAIGEDHELRELAGNVNMADFTPAHRSAATPHQQQQQSKQQEQQSQSQYHAAAAQRTEAASSATGASGAKAPSPARPIALRSGTNNPYARSPVMPAGYINAANASGYSGGGGVPAAGRQPMASHQISQGATTADATAGGEGGAAARGVGGSAFNRASGVMGAVAHHTAPHMCLPAYHQQLRTSYVHQKQKSLLASNPFQAAHIGPGGTCLGGTGAGGGDTQFVSVDSLAARAGTQDAGEGQLYPPQQQQRGSSTPCTGTVPANFTEDEYHRARMEVELNEPHLMYPGVRLPQTQCNLGENDERRRRLEQRRKQIAYGKDTDGYRAYRDVVPRVEGREYHNPMHPVTPRPEHDCSKRTFDKYLNAWRRQLHQWDMYKEAAESGSIDVGSPFWPLGVATLGDLGLASSPGHQHPQQQQPHQHMQSIAHVAVPNPIVSDGAAPHHDASGAPLHLRHSGSLPRAGSTGASRSPFFPINRLSPPTTAAGVQSSPGSLLRINYLRATSASVCTPSRPQGAEGPEVDAAFFNTSMSPTSSPANNGNYSSSAAGGAGVGGGGHSSLAMGRQYGSGTHARPSSVATPFEYGCTPMRRSNHTPTQHQHPITKTLLNRDYDLMSPSGRGSPANGMGHWSSTPYRPSSAGVTGPAGRNSGSITQGSGGGGGAPSVNIAPQQYGNCNASSSVPVALNQSSGSPAGLQASGGAYDAPMFGPSGVPQQPYYPQMDSSSGNGGPGQPYRVASWQQHAHHHSQMHRGSGLQSTAPRQ